MYELPEAKGSWKNSDLQACPEEYHDPDYYAYETQLGWIIGGSVALEIIFSIPGIGRLMVDAILAV